jgi:hypothetical protein
VIGILHPPRSSPHGTGLAQPGSGWESKLVQPLPTSAGIHPARRTPGLASRLGGNRLKLAVWVSGDERPRSDQVRPFLHPESAFLDSCGCGRAPARMPEERER